MTDKECQKLADCYGFPFYRHEDGTVSNVNIPGSERFDPKVPNEPINRYEIGGLGR